MEDQLGQNSGTPHGNLQAGPIVIQQTAPKNRRSWLVRGVLAVLMVSLFFNLALLSAYREYFTDVTPPTERFHSGQETAEAKIAVIDVVGTIMPPFTDRIIRAIKRAREDEKVKGVVLTVDSPGGFVADSHQIYHELTQLREEKPIYVAMKRMAASGGYYVAMGAGPDGRIFAEPTTWTGSIGVIIPRYDLRKLAEKFGVESAPLKTGAFKDSLSPFRELTAEEKKVWDRILDDSFQRFLNVIADNRANLDYDAVRKLATGQIYTASDAQEEHGLVDEIGYEEDAIASLEQRLQKMLGVDEFRVVTYHFQPSMVELLMGAARAERSDSFVREWLETTVPRAMYYCSWGPPSRGSD